MLESKRKNLATVDLRSNHNATKNPLDVRVDPDLLGEEDNWIIVKKQRVNILIPRLSSSEQSRMPDLEQGQLCGNVTDILSEVPLEKPPKARLPERIDGSHSSQEVYCSPADNAVAISKPRKVDLRVLTGEDQTGDLRGFSGFYKTSPKHVRPSMPSGLYGVCNSSISSINLSKKVRASYLERNILSAGGLGGWLSSLGLGQFEGIFRAKNINKFHMTDLSMKKLKDMGAHAVGPRRKLIHAIESVCHPY